MMVKDNGRRAVTDSGGVDSRYVVEEILIEADGGDW